MKIIKDKTHNVWFFSDPHYSHKNIVAGVTEWDKSRANNSTRKFDTIKQMNRTIVDNINEVVMQKDTLICLGDWSFGGIEEIWNFRQQIICEKIILVLGNHDHHIRDNKVLPNVHQHRDYEGVLINGKNTNSYGDSRDDMFGVHAHDLFEWVGDYLDLTIVDNTGSNLVSKNRISMVCTHYPMASWDRLGKGNIHLHGHIHTSKQFIIPKIGKMMDVGMDGNDMKPWSLDDVVKLMGRQKIGGLLQHGGDHHIDKDTH